MAMQADRVRVAYGTVPVILAGLPSDHPVRTRIREDVCALLLGTGYLTEAELGTLDDDPVTTSRRIPQRRHDLPRLCEWCGESWDSVRATT
jgi:hypothetical protein